MATDNLEDEIGKIQLSPDEGSVAEECNNSEKESKGLNSGPELEGKMPLEVKLFIRALASKSLFSEAARKEIENENFSEEEKSYLQHMKLDRIHLFISAKEMDEEYKKMTKICQTNDANDSQEKLPKASSTVKDKEISENAIDHQNRESFTAGKSCNVEARAEGFDCWEKCKASQNIDCPYCGSRGTLDHLEKEYYELYIKCKMEAYKKRRALIANYNGFKAIKPENEVFYKSLFPETAHQNENISEEEKRDIKLLKLLRILHVRNCDRTLYNPYFKTESKVVDNCTFPDCKTLRAILFHVDRCPDRELCPEGSCLQVRELLSHWNRCLEEKNFTCSFCGDYLSNYFSLEEELIGDSMEYHKKMEEVQKRVANIRAKLKNLEQTE